MKNGRGSYYNLAKCGMKYPGLPADSKSYLWKSVYQPTLLYGIECLAIGDKQVRLRAVYDKAIPWFRKEITTY